MIAPPETDKFTLLDQLAIEAMKVFIAESRHKNGSVIAEYSYAMAQAMMNERERQ